MTNYKIISILEAVFLSCTVAIFAVCSAHVYSKYYVFSNYSRNFTLAEDIILDSPAIVSRYGAPLNLYAGTKGEISDKVDYWSDELGYEYISAKLYLEKDIVVRAAISVENETNDLLVISLNGPVKDEGKPIIAISKIEPSALILEEYKYSRDLYRRNVVTTYIVFLIIGSAAVVGLLAGWFYFLKIVRSGERSVYKFVFAVASIDFIVLLIALFAIHLLW